MNKLVSYVNGTFLPHENASLSIDDRASLFSDGVYEVMEIIQGQPFQWEAHMRRLQRSLDGIRIPYHVDAATLLASIHTLLEQNASQNGFIYLQISRGVAPRDHGFPPAKTPVSIVMTYKPPLKNAPETGTAITRPDLRWKRRDLKTISLLPNILAKQDAIESHATEAILVEDDHSITEGSASNVFIVDQKNCLWTHPANTRILNGITRELVLALAKEEQIAIKESAFHLKDLYAAKEVFITSTTKHILPLVAVDKSVYEVGDTTKRLMGVLAKVSA